MYAGPHSYTQWLNPAAFAEPPIAMAIGQADYSPLAGSQQQVCHASYVNLDSAVLKLGITESVRLQFRADVEHNKHARVLSTRQPELHLQAVQHHH